jgi:hypothetical protein
MGAVLIRIDANLLMDCTNSKRINSKTANIRRNIAEVSFSKGFASSATAVISYIPTLINLIVLTIESYSYKCLKSDPLKKRDQGC